MVLQKILGRVLITFILLCRAPFCFPACAKPAGSYLSVHDLQGRTYQPLASKKVLTCTTEDWSDPEGRVGSDPEGYARRLKTKRVGLSACTPHPPGGGLRGTASIPHGFIRYGLNDISMVKIKASG